MSVDTLIAPVIAPAAEMTPPVTPASLAATIGAAKRHNNLTTQMLELYADPSRPQDRMTITSARYNPDTLVITRYGALGADGRGHTLPRTYYLHTSQQTGEVSFQDQDSYELRGEQPLPADEVMAGLQEYIANGATANYQTLGRESLGRMATGLVVPEPRDGSLH